MQACSAWLLSSPPHKNILVILSKCFLAAIVYPTIFLSFDMCSLQANHLP